MTSHIVAMGGGGFSAGDPLLDRYVLDLTGAERPKVAFIGTASGDAVTYHSVFLEAFAGYGCEPSIIRLFQREIEDLTAHCLDQDVIYVGGGNTLNMLSIWRLHGLDEALREAWQNGVVLCGVSAGANCWFEASSTDSYLMGTARPLLDGLGLVEGSFCPHYDSEPERRPNFIDDVASGALPAGFACDDFAAVHVSGGEARAISSRTGAQAYRVTAEGETELETRLLT